MNSKNIPFIKVLNVSKNFGNTNALVDISFNVNSGEIVGLIGPNGAGKSTLMKSIVGFLPIKYGEIYVCEENVIKNPQAVQKLIGYLPESSGIYTDVNVKEFLTFIANSHKCCSGEMKAAAHQAGCEEYMKQNVESLSKGQRQRVMLAASIMQNPPILMLDEPFDGLDPNQKSASRKLLKQYAKNKAVIFSTHVLEDAKELCDRVVVLNNGRIVANESTATFAKRGDGSLEKAFEKITSQNNKN